MKKTLDDFINSVKKDVEGYVGVAVIDTNDGSIVADDSISPINNMKTNAPIIAQIYLQALQSMQLTHNDNPKLIEEILITTQDEYYVFSTTPENKFLLILLVDKKKTNIGLIRATLDKYRKTR